MASKSSGALPLTSSYTLGKYSFRIERSSGTSPNYDKIEAICTNGGKNARKSIQIPSRTKIKSWNVEANETEASVYITVDDEIASIEIVTLPLKTGYTSGEALDITGMVVKAYYGDGTEYGTINNSELILSPANGTILHSNVSHDLTDCTDLAITTDDGGDTIATIAGSQVIVDVDWLGNAGGVDFRKSDGTPFPSGTVIEMGFTQLEFHSVGAYKSSFWIAAGDAEINMSGVEGTALGSRVVVMTVRPATTLSSFSLMCANPSYSPLGRIGICRASVDYININQSPIYTSGESKRVGVSWKRPTDRKELKTGFDVMVTAEAGETI